MHRDERLGRRLGTIDDIDIRGNLETISNLALVGMMCVDLGKHMFIPTILEVLYEHIQRLVDEYAVAREEEGV